MVQVSVILQEHLNSDIIFRIQLFRSVLAVYRENRFPIFFFNALLKFHQIRSNLMNELRKFVSNILNPFLTNVPLMQKPGRWFLLTKCLKNTRGRVTF